jgi:hypothetical protein
MHLLICDICVHQFRAYVVKVWTHHIGSAYELALVPAKHGARVTKIQPSVFVVQIPFRSDFELAGANDYRHAMRARSGGSKEGTAN